MLQKIHAFWIIALLLFTTNFFQYVNWDYTRGGHISYFLIGAIILIIFFNRSKITSFKPRFSNIILLLTFLPLLSFITMSENGAEPEFYKRYVYSLGIIFIYFIFIIYRVTPKTLIVAFTIFAFAVLIIQVVQQFNVSNAVFGVFSKNDEKFATIGYAEIRNGLYRFRLGVAYYTTFWALYYSFENFLKKTDFVNLFVFALLFVSIYLYLTRQIMAITIFCLLLSVVIKRADRTGLFQFIIFIGIVFIVYSYKDVLMADYFMHTKGEFQGEETRDNAFNFFWLAIFKDWNTLLFGNGLHQDQIYFQEEFGMFSSDVGLVGQIYHYGIIWGVVFVVSYLYILSKSYKYIPLYLRLFFITIFIDLVLMCPMQRTSLTMVFMAGIYMCEYYYRESKLNKLGLSQEDKEQKQLVKKL